METPGLYTVLNMLEDVPHQCFITLVTKGSSITAFNHLATQSMCCTDKGSHPICQELVEPEASTTKVYQQCWKK